MPSEAHGRGWFRTTDLSRVKQQASDASDPVTADQSGRSAPTRSLRFGSRGLIPGTFGPTIDPTSRGARRCALAAGATGVKPPNDTRDRDSALMSRIHSGDGVRTHISTGDEGPPQRRRRALWPTRLVGAHEERAAAQVPQPAVRHRSASSPSQHQCITRSRPRHAASSLPPDSSGARPSVEPRIAPSMMALKQQC
jgi:hypothetical protein